MRSFIRKFNGWLGFALASVAFFIVPHFYRSFDPTAGQFDAGYIHPIIYAAVAICFSSGLAWTLVLFTAPGSHKQLDQFFEASEDDAVLSKLNMDAVLLAFILYLIYFLTTIAFIAWVV
jgi:hypothetical protein